MRSNYNHERLIFYSENQTRWLWYEWSSWVSSDRSLAASMVFPLNFNIKDNAPKLLPLIFALLIARILENAMFPKRVSLGIKWPNDLYKDGRKVGGILLHLIINEKKKKFQQNSCSRYRYKYRMVTRDNNRFNASALYDCLKVPRLLIRKIFFKN